MDTKETQCSDCSHGCACHRRWAHWAIKILVLLFIFWCGMQFGELRGELRAQYSGFPMMNAYGDSQGYPTGAGMGRVFYSTISQPTTTPRQ
jgi:hypothetical protein